MQHEWLVVALSLCAAVAFAGSSSLKHVSAGNAPDAQSLNLGKLRSFVTATVSHRVFLAGIACDIVGLTMQILALHLGALSIVQPLLVTSLLFAMALRQCFEADHIPRRDVAWALALSAALAGLLLLASNAAPVIHAADRVPAIVAAIVGLVLAVTCVELGRRQQSQGRSGALTGIAVGVIYAATAALLKALTNIAAIAPLHLFLSWQLYVVVLLGASGLLLNQVAFQAGPITASLPATASVDPLLSIVIGVLVYDEHIRRGWGGGIALVALIVLLGITVVQLSRSPAATTVAMAVTVN